MNTSALITIILVWGVVFYFTGYFFYKVLTNKKKED
ncbi:MAG TPA: DUF3149 domain-containing protein [Tenuifilaceae bacterium]|nr:DUF3149 domain-containing protein [Tenuifilaceae bacterium]HPI44660.1 DUF3149 domain-containing protein [Tenuifilaceae bacterium]HPN23037.1 DUF3149 domain-containing protein [Tenuifilaceae bacterium]HPV56033.1 DUF3149 domain-containing protein [Tenuifilaceae bacterium]